MNRLILFVLLYSTLSFAVNGDITAVRISGQTQRTVADGNITATATTLTSATAAFTSSDVGRNVIVRGAGAAGADLNTRITVVTNATTVTVENAAGTTVTNASTVIGDEQNGSVAEIDISGLAAGGTYTSTGFGAGLTGLANAGVTPIGTITCTVPTYDATGTPGTGTVTANMTWPVRRPYPNNASNDEFAAGGTVTIRVWLSGQFFSADTLCTATIGSGLYTQAATPNNAVTGISVTNNSTLSYSDVTPILRWAQPPAQLVTGASVNPELVAFSQFAQNSKPLAAVIFTCTDQHANSVSATVNSMTVSTWQTDPNKVLVYTSPISDSMFTQGDLVTCNAVAYPWRGNATTTTATGVTVGDERLTPETYLIDKTGAYAGGVAYVDPINGHNSAATTWVAATVAAAESAYVSSSANSYTTISNAVEAVRAYNNANKGRNQAGGSTIVLVAGNHTYPGLDAASGCPTDETTTDTWLTIQNRSGTTPTLNAATSCFIGVRKVKISGLSIATGGAVWTFGEGGSGTKMWEWFNADTMNVNNTAWDYGHLQGYATMNTLTAMDNNGLAIHFVKSPFALVRGNTVTTPGSGTLEGYDYAFLGNKGLSAREVDGGLNFQGAQFSDLVIDAFNSGFNLQNNGGQVLFTSTTSNLTGAAYVQNMWEEQTGSVGLMSLCADSSSNVCKNIIVWNNTMVGGRTNMAYDENTSSCATSYLRTLWSFKFNISSNLNIAGTDLDTTHGCAADGARTGNWPVLNMVGAAGNVNRAWSASATYFPPEFLGLYSTSTATLGFTNDQSQNVTGTGNGTYTLTVSSALKNIIPKTQCVIPFDIAGNARCVGANGSVGAYAYNEAATSVPYRNVFVW